MLGVAGGALVDNDLSVVAAAAAVILVAELSQELVNLDAAVTLEEAEEHEDALEVELAGHNWSTRITWN